MSELRRPAAFLLVALLAGAVTPSRAAEEPDLWRYSLSLGPTLTSPRMHGLNNALQFDGFDAVDKAWVHDGASRFISAHGWRATDFGYGGQAQLGYQVNEDLRAALQVGLVWVGQKDVAGLTDPTTAFSTTYIATEAISLPLLQVGFAIQKIFTFEEEPSLHLYLGGWGTYGRLVGATLKGDFTSLPPSPLTGNVTDFQYDLRGDGWGAGGLAGFEYLLSGDTALYGETGYENFDIPSIERQGKIFGYLAQNAGRLTTSAAKPIDLDFSGVFFRVGVKVGFGRFNGG